MGIVHTDPVVVFVTGLFDLLVLLMIGAFILTALILTFNRFYDTYYAKTYKFFTQFVVRYLIDETEEVPAPDVLSRRILRDVIVDLLFITKGPGVESLKLLYQKNRYYQQDLALLRHRAWHKRLGAIVRLDQWRSIIPSSDAAFLLSDENKDVRTHAMKALSNTHDPEMAKKIIDHLSKDKIDISIRYECLSRLLNHHRYLILDTLKDPAWKELAPFIITVLGDKRDISSVPFIMEAASGEGHALKESAFVALGKIGDPRGLSFLLDGLGSETWTERLAAMKSLESIDEDLFRKQKDFLLSDPDPLVRGWAQYLLRKEEMA